jgi:uncharacterized protein YqeY
MEKIVLMTTYERIREDMKTAMREKDSVRLNTVRMVISDLKNREIEKRSPLEENEVIDALSSAVKKRREVIAEAQAAGRADIAEKEIHELKLIEGYLPAGLTPAELESLIAAAIQESGAATAQDFGKVMKILMPQVKGRADGKVVTDTVKAKLGG